MTPFTPVANWPLGGQDLTAANEIITSYFEHRKVLGHVPSMYSLLAAGDNAQRVYNNPSWGGDGQGESVFQEMQKWMEDNCGSFLNTTNATSFLTEDKSDFVYFTRTTWQEAAGLNVSAIQFESYRRKVAMVDDWSYGTFLPGDIRGPWCFEDLQKGLNALKRTKCGGWDDQYGWVYPYSEHKYVHWYGYINPPWPDFPTAAEMRATIKAQFDAQEWHYNQAEGYFLISASEKFITSPYGNYELHAERNRLYQSLGLPEVNRKVDIYIFTNSDPNYFDLDGNNLVPDKWTLYRSDDETSETPIILNWISDVAACPLHDGPGAWIQSSQSPYSFPRYVLKWQFSNGED